MREGEYLRMPGEGDAKASLIWQIFVLSTDDVYAVVWDLDFK